MKQPEPPKLTTRQLRKIGEDRHGPRHWKKKLAAEIFVSERTMRYWAAETIPIPPSKVLAILSLPPLTPDPEEA